MTSSWGIYSGIFIASYANTNILIYSAGVPTNSSIILKDVCMFDLTQMFGSTIANYLYNQGSAGVNKFRILFPKPYYPYNAGELVSVKTAGRKTIGINQWDEDWELGTINNSGSNVPSNDYIRSKNYIRVIPNNTYYIRIPNNRNYRLFFYDFNNVFISMLGWQDNTTFTVPVNAFYLRFVVYSSYGTTYNHDICINISDASINGTYYPYEPNEYPCEQIELNGLYKLDSNNNLIADGDEYKNDGTVTRRYGVVDLGTLNWAYDDTYLGFRSPLNPSAKQFFKGICSKYPFVGAYDYVNDKQCGYIFYSYIFIKDSTYGTSAAAFKTAMSGVMLVYELATPTSEETVASFASTQKTGITEQFMEPTVQNSVFLPVGHDSLYLPDLKNKLEIAPDSPITDGVYLVSRSSGTNVYVPIADVTATQSEIDEIIEILQ